MWELSVTEQKYQAVRGSQSVPSLFQNVDRHRHARGHTALGVDARRVGRRFDKSCVQVAESAVAIGADVILANRLRPCLRMRFNEVERRVQWKGLPYREPGRFD
jgi:hypothetical protein